MNTNKLKVFFKNKTRLPKLKTFSDYYEPRPVKTKIAVFDHVETFKIEITSNEFNNPEPKKMDLEIDRSGIDTIVTLRDSALKYTGIMPHIEFLATKIYWNFLWRRDIHPENVQFKIIYDHGEKIENISVKMAFNVNEECFEDPSFITDSYEYKRHALQLVK